MPETITFNEILDTITDYVTIALTANIIQLSVTGNPQADSLANQKIIGDSLKAFTLGHSLFVELGLIFEAPSSPTFWCDFIIRSHDNKIWLPINLKVSTCDGRDDLSSKGGLFYALTGENPEQSGIRDWKRFCRELANRVKHDHCTADYYYLVVQKTRPGEPKGIVFWTSLLSLRYVHPNGNRPPFQCHWGENRERAIRSRQESIVYLVGVLEETLQLRAQALASFTQYLSPLLREWHPEST